MGEEEGEIIVHYEYNVPLQLGRPELIKLIESINDDSEDDEGDEEDGDEDEDEEVLEDDCKFWNSVSGVWTIR